MVSILSNTLTSGEEAFVRVNINPQRSGLLASRGSDLQKLCFEKEEKKRNECEHIKSRHEGIKKSIPELQLCSEQRQEDHIRNASHSCTSHARNHTPKDDLQSSFARKR
jgi:hypothetical protein